jgi:excinuclease UvrABC nuclease subunit
MKNYPIRSYLNAHTQKKQIYLENKNKSGIYRWTNTTTGKIYVESSINLAKRFTDYFSIVFLDKELKKVEVLYTVHY